MGAGLLTVKIGFICHDTGGVLGTKKKKSMALGENV
jgi:hypothetical protein